jgi:hypothetical protein
LLGRAFLTIFLLFYFWFTSAVNNRPQHTPPASTESMLWMNQAAEDDTRSDDDGDGDTDTDGDAGGTWEVVATPQIIPRTPQAPTNDIDEATMNVSISERSACILAVNDMVDEAVIGHSESRRCNIADEVQPDKDGADLVSPGGNMTTEVGAVAGAVAVAGAETKAELGAIDKVETLSLSMGKRWQWPPADKALCTSPSHRNKSGGFIQPASDPSLQVRFIGNQRVVSKK